MTQGGKSDETQLYELPADLTPLRSVRGSILFLDWSWLKSHGYYERYAERVDPAHRETLHSAATSDWVGVDFLMAHYRALDGLDLSYAEAFDVGRLVGERAHGALLATILRLAGGVGATPWFGMGYAHRMWERTWRGGGIRIWRVGERLARVESIGNPAAVSAFHRASFAGAFDVGLQLLCKRSRIEEIARLRTDTSFALSLGWT